MRSRFWVVWIPLNVLLRDHTILTRWGWVTHICVDKLTIIGSDNGLSPAPRQAIIWTNAGILLIRPLKTNFSEILIRIKKISFTQMHLKMSSAKWRPFYLSLNVLTVAQGWHMASWILVIIGPDNGFLSDCTKTISEAIFNYGQLNTRKHISMKCY